MRLSQALRHLHDLLGGAARDAAGQRIGVSKSAVGAALNRLLRDHRLARAARLKVDEEEVGREAGPEGGKQMRPAAVPAHRPFQDEHGRGR
jgi:hypothetical protein